MTFMIYHFRQLSKIKNCPVWCIRSLGQLSKMIYGYSCTGWCCQQASHPWTPTTTICRLSSSSTQHLLFSTSVDDGICSLNLFDSCYTWYIFTYTLWIGKHDLFIASVYFHRYASTSSVSKMVLEEIEHIQAQEDTKAIAEMGTKQRTVWEAGDQVGCDHRGAAIKSWIKSWIDQVFCGYSKVNRRGGCIGCGCRRAGSRIEYCYWGSWGGCQSDLTATMCASFSHHSLLLFMHLLQQRATATISSTILWWCMSLKTISIIS